LRLDWFGLGLYWCSWSAVEELEGMVAVVFVGYCFEVVEVERESGM
jgi:hypothetical protein